MIGSLGCAREVSFAFLLPHLDSRLLFLRVMRQPTERANGNPCAFR